jgi:c-di-GMP-binding flagellar brake protein YcgR
MDRVSGQELSTLPGLKPGTRMIITLPPLGGGSEEKTLTTNFEGFHDDGLIIVGTPLYQGKVFELPIGRIYPITYVADDKVYYMNCHAKQYFREGELHFTLLERVSEAQIIERRETFRLSISLPCVFNRYVDGKCHDTVFAAKILDISAGGARLLARVPLEVGEDIRCGVSLGEHGHKELPSKIVWVKPVLRAVPGTFQAGLAFNSLPRTEESVVIKYIYNEQFQRRRTARKRL